MPKHKKPITRKAKKFYYTLAVLKIHWTTYVRNWLKQQFSNSGIDRGVPELRPLWSPDIFSFDFITWGYLKHTAYKTTCPDIEELKRWEWNSNQSFTIPIMSNKWNQIKYHLVILWDTITYLFSFIAAVFF